MKILITGGAGFIGGHLAEAALAKGWDVCVVDDLSTGRIENVPSAATLRQVDIRDVAALQLVFDEFRPDLVSHQAAQASVAISVREPQLDAQINVIGSLNVMRAAAATGVGRFVFASTGGAIYGEVPEGVRASVETPPVPLSPYACSKFAVEKYLEAFRIEHGLDYTILRYANVYGPRQDPHGEAGVVAIFCQRLLRGDPIQVNARREAGDPGCVRDYVYVSDVVGANIAACEGRIPDRVLNIGTGVETTTQQLADFLKERLQSSSKVGAGPNRAGDVERSLLDADRLIELLGAPVALHEGLSRTADWFAKAAQAG